MKDGYEWYQRTQTQDVWIYTFLPDIYNILTFYKFLNKDIYDQYD